MHWTLSLLILTGVTNAVDSPANNVVNATYEERLSDLMYYEDYSQAYRSAQSSGAPMLVILNPAGSSEKPRVELEKVLRSRVRRDLLKNYVVAYIDAGSKHGQVAHRLFGSTELPRVVVIDKQQQNQIYRNSNSMTMEDWNLVLKKYEKGQPIVQAAATITTFPADCFT